jgi:hypothetical protein
VRAGDTSFFDRTVRWQKARRAALQRQAEERSAEQEETELAECTFRPLSRAEIHRRWGAKHGKGEQVGDASSQALGGALGVLVGLEVVWSPQLDAALVR